MLSRFINATRLTARPHSDGFRRWAQQTVKAEERVLRAASFRTVKLEGAFPWSPISRMLS
jgi:hypothetical protein